MKNKEVSYNINLDDYSEYIHPQTNPQTIFLSEDDNDDVNHPSHYCQDNSMECIDEMIAVFGVEAVKHFCLLNVWKYRKRAIFKNGEQDYKKSDWYMRKFIELDKRDEGYETD